MAVIAPRRIRSPLDGRHCWVYVWGPFSAGDTFIPMLIGEFSDKTVQGVKDSGAAFGGNVGVEISCQADKAQDATDIQYFTPTDNQGAPISGKVSGFGAVIIEHCYWVRPTVGAGVADVTLYVMSSGA
jgi:hypothetical protein